jgi:hypothetical protein
MGYRHELFMLGFIRHNIQAWISVNLLHLRPAKWYTFQLKSSYIIQPLNTSKWDIYKEDGIFRCPNQLVSA